MKHTKIIFLFAVLLLLFNSSCKKEDEINKPSINVLEFGYNDSGIAYAGGDLHIEADIVAEGNIDRIKIEIHPEGDYHKKNSNSEWIVDTIYTKFQGLKNTMFHEHLEVPMETDTGDYHFHIEVVDMEGNSTSVEKELLIEMSNDTVAPEISISNFPENQKTFMFGETIEISGIVSDNSSLGGLYIGLVRNNQNLSDAVVSNTNTITMFHYHDFENEAQMNFEASIVVGAEFDNDDPAKDITGEIAWEAGYYYIVVKCKDGQGENVSYSDHYEINIDL